LDRPATYTNTQIYQEALTARFTPTDQAEYDEILACDCGQPYGHRNTLDALEERLMVSPGSRLWNGHGFRPVVDARGLLFANRQIYDEATTILYAKNTFVVAMNETFRFRVPGQIFPYMVAPSSIAKIRRLAITVTADVDIDNPHYTKAIAALKHNILHVAKSLNNAKVNLKLLKVRYISCYAGDLEQNRRDVDALLVHPGARPVQLMRRDGMVDTLTRNDVKRFHIQGFAFGNALCSLEVPIEHVEIYGDLPTTIVKKLNRKFNVTANPESKSSDVDIPPEAEEPVDQATGQSRNSLAEVMQRMAANNPTDGYMAEMARMLGSQPVRSHAVMEMLFSPITKEEIERANRGW